MTPPSSSTEKSNAARTLPERLSSVAESSRTASSLATLRAWSRYSVCCLTLLGFVRRLSRTVPRWTDRSVLYRLTTALTERFETAFERLLRHSRGYRWLTADPNPNVIVIDLRETKTIGPLLRVLERVLSIVVPAVIHSRTRRIWREGARRLRGEPLRYVGGVLLTLAIASAVSAVLDGSFTPVQAIIVTVLALCGVLAVADGRSWSELGETRMVGLLAAVFLPPEPPDNDS